MSENQPDTNGQSSPESTPDPPRDNKGKFAPKQSAPKSPTPSAEPVAPTSPPQNDSLLDEIEGDLTEALKGRFDPKDIKDLDQRMRIKMLRILSKVDGSKRNPTVDPTTPPPPQEEHIPTLAELNRADKYRADMSKQTSYVGRVSQWRQGK